MLDATCRKVLPVGYLCCLGLQINLTACSAASLTKFLKIVHWKVIPSPYFAGSFIRIIPGVECHPDWFIFRINSMAQPRFVQQLFGVEILEGTVPEQHCCFREDQAWITTVVVTTVKIDCPAVKIADSALNLSETDLIFYMLATEVQSRWTSLVYHNRS